MKNQIRKMWPIAVSIGSASVMILAFFIPSIQDQWDRYQSRKVIQQYVTLGNSFFEEDRFEMAEQAYAKAFELSEDKRLDIEVRRLRAKVSRIGVDPAWDATLPEDIREIDFQYLLHLVHGDKQKADRISILNSYGIFLALSGKAKDAEQAFRQAIQLDSLDAATYVNQGNLFDQEGRFEAAEKAYRTALLLDSANARAHYNLGLLYVDAGKMDLAKLEFLKALQLNADDKDARRELDLISSPAK